MKNGFTLLEVLIALLAAALISIMSFDFLSNTIFLKERIDNSISNNSKHSKAIHLMRLDMIQAIPFELKDQTFNSLNNVFIGSNEERILTFVSLNSSDTASSNSMLRRIIYRYRDKGLVRTTTLANNENIVVSEEILMKGIGRLRNVKQGPDGYVYFAIEEPGRVYKIIPVSLSASSNNGRIDLS